MALTSWLHEQVDTARAVAARSLRAAAPVRGSFRVQRLLAPSALAARHPEARDSRYPIAPRGPAEAPPAWRGSTATFVGWHAWYRGCYELETLGVLAAHLAPGTRLVEVGANEGYHTVFGAWCVGAEGRVTAYEPNAHPRTNLEANVARLGWQDRVVVRAVAADARAGERALYVPDEAAENQGVGGFFPDAVVATRPVIVPTTTLDEDLTGEPCDLLKLDVQGAEHLVLRGAVDLLRRCAPRVYFEVEPGMGGAAEALALVRDLGYTTWRVLPRRRPPWFALAEAPAAPWRGNCLALPPATAASVRARG